MESRRGYKGDNRIIDVNLCFLSKFYLLLFREILMIILLVVCGLMVKKWKVLIKFECLFNI